MRGDMFIGIILSFASGAFVALSMVTQRYALTYPDYKVPVLGIFKLPRPAVWLLGLVLYGAANALFAAAQLFGPLSLMSSLFVLLLEVSLLVLCYAELAHHPLLAKELDQI